MSDDHDQFRRYFEEQFGPVYHKLSTKQSGVAVCCYHDKGKLLLCYTDMVDERYEVELEYEELRWKRDKMKARNKDADGKYLWKEWLKWLLGCLEEEAFSTTWNGVNEDGVEVLTLAVSDSGVAFDLIAADAVPIKTAALVFTMFASFEAANKAASDSRSRVMSLSRELDEERSKASSLRHSLDAYTGGIGIEAHQRDDDAAKRANHKRKAQSLVNPCEKIRKPRGTRIGN